MRPNYLTEWAPLSRSRFPCLLMSFRVSTHQHNSLPTNCFSPPIAGWVHSFCNLKKIYNEHQQEVLTEWPPEYFQKSYKAIHVYRGQELISFSSHSTSTQALRTFVREMNLSCCWSCFLEMINKTESDLKDVSLLQGTLMTKSGC